MSSKPAKARNGKSHHPRSVKRITGKKATSPARRRGMSVRRRSKAEIFGVPLWEVARGPNPSRGERVGHARAIVAVGDIADGIVAIGGISRGVVSIGGISLGVFSLGGISVGLAAALGGVAVAPLALGGVALGVLARGGSGLDRHGRFHHRPVSLWSRLADRIPRFVRGLTEPPARRPENPGLDRLD